MLVRSVTLNGVTYAAGTPMEKIPEAWLDLLDQAGHFGEPREVAAPVETKPLDTSEIEVK